MGFWNTYQKWFKKLIKTVRVIWQKTKAFFSPEKEGPKESEKEKYKQTQTAADALVKESEKLFTQIDNGLHIAYYDRGKGLNTLLFVHGLGGSAAHWQRNLDELAAHNRCIVIDLPGYGDSEAPQKQNIKAEDLIDFFAESIGQLAEKLNLNAFVLIGHSMGGLISANFTLKYPQKVQKLILASPAGIEHFSTVQKTMIKSFSKSKLFENQSESDIRNAYAQNFYSMPAQAEALIQKRLALQADAKKRRIYAQWIEKCIVAMLANPVREQLAHIEIPCLVIYGEQDKLIPNPYLNKHLKTHNIANIAADKLPYAKVVLVPEAGHLLPFEQPEAFNQQVLVFLDSWQSDLDAR
ncbi:MAG: alpha/beta hydrolase [Bernardetiaceae bacterium]|nr:alpha/beta hydrolase [Bernardetiaceae bacterium]